jgi:hypothetical protein
MEDNTDSLTGIQIDGDCLDTHIARRICGWIEVNYLDIMKCPVPAQRQYLGHRVCSSLQCPAVFAFTMSQGEIIAIAGFESKGFSSINWSTLLVINEGRMTTWPVNG